MEKFVSREWLPHEKPSLPGSPSTPLHTPSKRLAYGTVGLLVAITGGLGNALVTANLQFLQGALGATTAEMAWLPAAYVMTNVSMNLLLVKPCSVQCCPSGASTGGWRLRLAGLPE